MDCEIPEVGGSLVSNVNRLVRYGMVALGGYLVGQGWLQADTAEALTAVVTTAAPIALGVIIGRMNRNKLKQAVAVAKSKDSASA